MVRMLTSWINAVVVHQMLSSNASRVLRRIERTAERHFLPIIGQERGRILAELARRFKPKRVLEVGTLVGYSTILIGKELDGDAEIVTIEIDEAEAEWAKRNVRDAEINPKVRVLIGDALHVIPRLEGEFDMVFLDADKSDYLDHLGLIEAHVHKGSVVIADNAGAYAYSMRDYLDYVRKSGKYDSSLVAAGGDGVEVSIKR